MNQRALFWRGRSPQDIDQNYLRILLSKDHQQKWPQTRRIALAGRLRRQHVITPDQIARNAPLIMEQAVMTHAMPPNNITEITTEERHVLAMWLARR